MRTNRAALFSFLDAARWAFGYLRDLGFREEDLPARAGVHPYQIRFVSGKTRIVVEGADWGFGAELRAGPLDGRAVDLLPLLRRRAPAATRRIDEAPGLQNRLRLLAAALREHGPDVLAGDHAALPR